MALNQREKALFWDPVPFSLVIINELTSILNYKSHRSRRMERPKKGVLIFQLFLGKE